MFVIKFIITFSKDNKSFIVWSTDRGFYQSSLVGENFRLIENFNDTNGPNVTQISWHDGLIYNVLKNFSVVRYDFINNSSIVLANISTNGIAIDWLSKKLYWSDLRKNIVS